MTGATWPKVAALFVAPGGVYDLHPDVEAWTERMDARTYPGCLPVVAHPPCARWGRLYWTARHKGLGLGDDGGCFEAALASLRRWGGVLEHPAGSKAWAAFNLPVPSRHGGWTKSEVDGRLWSTCVSQRNYGHRAMKQTWLLYAGARRPPDLDWRRPASVEAWVTRGPRWQAAKAAGIQFMGVNEREATPKQFAELLIKLALHSLE